MLGVSTVLAAGASSVSSPREFFGFQPGSDRKLIDYEQLTGYMSHLAEVSPRVVMREVGRSVLDRPMYVVFFSTEGEFLGASFR